MGKILLVLKYLSTIAEAVKRLVPKKNKQPTREQRIAQASGNARNKSSAVTESMMREPAFKAAPTVKIPPDPYRQEALKISQWAESKGLKVSIKEDPMGYYYLLIEDGHRSAIVKFQDELVEVYHSCDAWQSMPSRRLESIQNESSVQSMILDCFKGEK